MNLVIFGPPGAGKGTQSNFICNQFKLVQFSTGDLLRDEIKKKNNLGKNIESIIKEGLFVPDEIVNTFLEKFISQKDNFNKIIFDGYPRNLNQIKILENFLEKYNQKLNAGIFLKVDKEIIKKRIQGRLFCNKCHKTFNEFLNPPTSQNHDCDKSFLVKRSDDNIETIIKRFDTYLEQTEPVLNYYKQHIKFFEIDGNKEISKISNEIRDILSNITN